MTKASSGAAHKPASAAKKAPTLQDVWHAVTLKAWKDPAFKKHLLSNPHAALKSLGVNVDAKINVKVYENTPTSLHFILPAAPKDAARLSDADLRRHIGGSSISGIEVNGPLGGSVSAISVGSAFSDTSTHSINVGDITMQGVGTSGTSFSPVIPQGY